MYQSGPSASPSALEYVCLEGAVCRGIEELQGAEAGAAALHLGVGIVVHLAHPCGDALIGQVYEGQVGARGRYLYLGAEVRGPGVHGVGPVSLAAVEKAQYVVGVVASHPPPHEVVFDGDEICAGLGVALYLGIEVASQGRGHYLVGIDHDDPVVCGLVDGKVAVCLGEAVGSPFLDHDARAGGGGYFDGAVGAFHVDDEYLVEALQGVEAAGQVLLGIVGVYDCGNFHQLRIWFTRRKRRRITSSASAPSIPRAAA